MKRQVAHIQIMAITVAEEVLPRTVKGSVNARQLTVYWVHGAQNREVDALRRTVYQYNDYMVYSYAKCTCNHADALSKAPFLDTTPKKLNPNDIE